MLNGHRSQADRAGKGQNLSKKSVRVLDYNQLSKYLSP